MVVGRTVRTGVRTEQLVTAQWWWAGEAAMDGGDDGEELMPQRVIDSEDEGMPLSALAGSTPDQPVSLDDE